jgi:hypothetical protein
LEITGLKKTIKAIWTLPVTNLLVLKTKKIEEMKEDLANFSGQLLDVDNFG